MVRDILKKREYIPILRMNNGDAVTRENWQKRRGEMLELLEKYSYGKTPDVQVEVRAEITENGLMHCAGKCTEQFIRLYYKTEKGEGSFPVQIFTPNAVEHPPVFLHIAFGLAPHKYIPVDVDRE